MVKTRSGKQYTLYCIKKNEIQRIRKNIKIKNQTIINSFNSKTPKSKYVVGETCSSPKQSLWSCTCLDFKYRVSPRGNILFVRKEYGCKHIREQ